MAARDAARRDPLAIRNQPALWTGRRRQWLIPAGVLWLVAVLMLTATLTLQILIPWAGIGLETLLYLTMLACAIGMRETHPRNVAFAWLMGAGALTPPAGVTAGGRPGDQ